MRRRTSQDRLAPLYHGHATSSLWLVLALVTVAGPLTARRASAEEGSSGYAQPRKLRIAATLTVSPENDPAERKDTRPTLELSIGDCIRHTLQDNYDVTIDRVQAQRAAKDVTIQQATFDPQIEAQTSVTRARRPSRSDVQFTETGITSVASSKDNAEALELGIGQMLITGADLGVSLELSRSDNIVGDTSINPYYGADLALSVTQPLLRDGWLPYNRSAIRLAHNSRLISIWSFKSSVMTELFNLETAYWNLVRSIENLRVSREALHRAKRLYENNRIRVQAGTMPEIEMLQALAEVALQREGVIVAQKEVRDREDAVKQLMNLCGQNRRMSDERLIPTSPMHFEEITIDRRQALRQARLNRPEYIMTELELKNERLRLRRSKNQMLPELDLAGSITYIGRDKSYRSALDNMDKEAHRAPNHTDLYSASVSLSLEYPIGNRAARSRYLQSRLDVTRRRLERERMDQQIQVEVRAAVREVITNIERVKATKVATALQRERLRAEEKKLSVGKSTSFDVLQAQEDLAIADRNEVRAIVDYRISRARLQRVKGTLLDAYNITVAEMH